MPGGTPRSERERAAAHYGVNLSEVTPEMIRNLPARGTGLVGRPRIVKCDPSLIELRNAIKREVADERNASSMYADMAAKLTHFGESSSADMLRLISGQELLHQTILEFIVDDITMRCGE